MEKVKEVYWHEKNFEVNNEMVTFRVEGTFNHQRGTFEVKRRRTTEQVAINSDQNTAIMGAVNVMENEMLGVMTELRKAWDGGRDDSEIQFPGDETEEFKSDKEWQQTADIANSYSLPKKEPQGEGGTDDEGDFSMSFVPGSQSEPAGKTSKK